MRLTDMHLWSLRSNSSLSSNEYSSLVTFKQIFFGMLLYCRPDQSSTCPLMIVRGLFQKRLPDRIKSHRLLLESCRRHHLQCRVERNRSQPCHPRRSRISPRCPTAAPVGNRPRHHLRRERRSSSLAPMTPAVPTAVPRTAPPAAGRGAPIRGPTAS